ncbi:hypothetical protein J4230_00435 [Candidatus Woesearchaeota archaeon]|nr:hypothetical protein [Candidatus Woesearchaeota archaeon]
MTEIFKAKINCGKNYIELRKINKKIGLIDSIIFTTSIMNDIGLVTKDNDFKYLRGVELI